MKSALKLIGQKEEKMAESLLAAKGLRYRHTRDWELGVDDFRLCACDFTGIVGPNGAGKSTLLRLLAGVLSPVEGQVLLKGVDLARYQRSEIARVVGYLPQENSCQFDYTVYDTVALGRYPHNTGFRSLGREDREVISRSLELTGLDGLFARRMSTLSGGERKRVFLAAVLSLEPEVLLLDEPGAALDLQHQSAFFRLLRELAGSGLAVAVVTHELNLASLFCTKTILLQSGRVLKSGKTEEIFTGGILREVYGQELGVFSHPESGESIVLPRREGKV